MDTSKNENPGSVTPYSKQLKVATSTTLRNDPAKNDQSFVSVA